MKTKAERRTAFNHAMSHLTTSLGGTTDTKTLGAVMDLFDAEAEAGYDESKLEADRVNVALTIADSTNWEQLAGGTQKAAADVLEKYLSETGGTV